jgi:hypothetical protein
VLPPTTEERLCIAMTYDSGRGEAACGRDVQLLWDVVVRSGAWLDKGDSGVGDESAQHI